MRYYNCLTCGKNTPDKWCRKTAQYCSVYCRTRIFIKVRDIPKPEITIFSGDTQLINGQFIVNAEYYEWLNQYVWHLGDTGYAVKRENKNGKKKTDRLHRWVINAQPNEIVDHINRNKLDNQFENLRIATQSENMRNTQRYDKAKNYTWDTSKNKWTVRIHSKFIGRYVTEQEAIDKVKEMTHGRYTERRFEGRCK